MVKVKVKKFVSYARTSTQKQRYNKTIEIQADRLNQYDLEHPDMVIVDNLQDDGLSGTKNEEGRPDYLKLKQYMEDPEIDGVISTQLDRLGRSNYELQKLFEEAIKKNNKTLIVLSHNLDTSTKEGKFAFDILCAQVEYDVRNIRENMKRGWDKEYKEHPERFGRPIKEIPEKLKNKIIHWYKVQKNGFSVICKFIQVENIKEYPDWFQRMYIGFGKIMDKEKENNKKRFYLSPSTIGVRLRKWDVKIRDQKCRQ
ncbi:hypothetical protein LCGC14_0900430 [marine sediment metagenome]|uniref:Resolvase/invertase-type recombinase catalytic domain-containing protein n=1 Tax=marine sediment metagenome TaxID=412755 RepID=A0A0F9RFN3_9ZZZZ